MAALPAAAPCCFVQHDRVGPGVTCGGGLVRCLWIAGSPLVRHVG